MKKNLYFFIVFTIMISCDPNDPTKSSLTINGNFNPKGFSINDSTKVYFSQGNLQYNPSEKTWRFATYQRDTLGSRNENISDNYKGWIDLFAWGTGNNPTALSGEEKFYDWGNNHIINGGNHDWFTLSKSEWEYLLNRRSHTSFRALVDGQRGLILLPDIFEQPDSVFYIETNSSKKWALEQNRFSEEEWLKMEANGAVFLPLTGERKGMELTYEHKRGVYWSRTQYNEDKAYDLMIKEEYNSEEKEYQYSHYANKFKDKYYGLAVRLVRKVD